MLSFRSRSVRAVVAIAASLPACCSQPSHLPPPDPKGRLVVDVHTHVFNCADLPIEGFLEHALGVPRVVAEIVGRILRNATPSEAAREVGSTLSDGQAKDVLEGMLRTEQARRASPGSDEDVRILLTGALDGLDRLNDVERARFDELAAEIAGPGAASASRKVSDVVDTLVRAVRWAHLMTHSSAWIADRLLETYPEVALFTPLMMDMGMWFDGSTEPKRKVEAQLEAAARLVVEKQGRLHPMVAFDPRRELRTGTSLALVRSAIEKGFVGVKVYPPLGYQAWDNANLPDPATDPRPADAKDWDAQLTKLYDYCAAEGVPISAHCSDPGAEARPGRGKRANPLLWKPVLDRYLQQGTPLSINFCHGGGVSDLVKNGEHSWTWTIGQMIQGGQTGVYFDLGYVEEILDPAQRPKVADALKRLFEAFPLTRQRVLYGTDWHMIVKEPRVEVFLAEHRAFFDEYFPDLTEGYLAGNALRFLGLEPGGKNRARLEAFYAAHGIPKPRWWRT